MAMIFAARRCGIPNAFAVSSRDKGVKSSLTGRRIFDRFVCLRRFYHSCPPCSETPFARRQEPGKFEFEIDLVEIE